MGADIVGKFKDRYILRNLTWTERIDLLQALQQRVSAELWRLEAYERRYCEALAMVEAAATVSQLADVYRQCNQLALEGFLESYSVRGAHQLCSDSREKITQRLLAQVEGEMVEEGFGPPPSPYAWFAVGSDGRRENTLFADQDDLLSYRYEETGVQKLLSLKGKIRERLVVLNGDGGARWTKQNLLDGYYQIFSHKMMGRLDEVGIKRCEGGVMPSNRKWRRSLHQWQEIIKGKVEHGRGDLTTLELIILMDLRCVAGDQSLGDELVSFVNTHVASDSELLTEMIRPAILMAVPIGFFKRFITEKTGEHKGKLNLKLGGWAPLVLIVRIFAKKYGLTTTNTMERIEGLRDAEVLSPEFAGELQEAYYALLKNRFLHQVELMSKGLDNDDYLDPETLSDVAQEELREALRKVEALQKLANRVFIMGGFTL